METIGLDHFFTSKTDAIEWVYQRLHPDTCLACPYRVFKECERDYPLIIDTTQP